MKVSFLTQFVSWYTSNGVGLIVACESWKWVEVVATSQVHCAMSDLNINIWTGWLNATQYSDWLKLSRKLCSNWYFFKFSTVLNRCVAHTGGNEKWTQFWSQDIIPRERERENACVSLGTTFRWIEGRSFGRWAGVCEHSCGTPSCFKSWAFLYRLSGRNPFKETVPYIDCSN
jgi:hypothetical protein